jgi:hypothetical protein
MLLLVLLRLLSKDTPTVHYYLGNRLARGSNTKADEHVANLDITESEFLPCDAL